jgi:hypothetical protein
MSKPVTQTEEHIFRKIHVIRNYKVLLDADLADLYGVETKVLKQAIRRNSDRFPEDFMFELTPEEWKAFQQSPSNLRSQIVTSSWGGSRYAPMAFTEQGVAMLSSVLKSKQAIDINIQIMRVFVKMRQLISSYSDLLKKIEKLEASDLEQNKHIKQIYDLIRELIEPIHKERKPIGFKASHMKE